jgi:hypothetical protein
MLGENANPFPLIGVAFSYRGRPGSILRAAALALCLAACGGSSPSDSEVRPEVVKFTHADEIIRGEGFMALADRREFAVFALLNATGFDEEMANTAMHPVRVKVRTLIASEMAKHPEKAAAWRQYIQSRRLAAFQYEDYALSLSTDYPFRRIRPDAELGYKWTAGKLQGFPPVLNDFWKTLRLGKIWSQVKPEYVAEIRKYDLQKMRRQMDFLWSYLRMPRQDKFTLVNVPNFLDAQCESIGARYENFYYTVESPGSYLYDLNVHEYLHSIVNRPVQTNFGPQEAKLSKYYKAGKAGPLCKDYQVPVTFTYESLVRALDHRLAILQSNDAADRKRIENQVAWETESGLKLTRPFYQLLPDFEKSDKPFDQFLPILFERLPECSQ